MIVDKPSHNFLVCFRRTVKIRILIEVFNEMTMFMPMMAYHVMHQILCKELWHMHVRTRIIVTDFKKVSVFRLCGGFLYCLWREKSEAGHKTLHYTQTHALKPFATSTYVPIHFSWSYWNWAAYVGINLFSIYRLLDKVSTHGRSCTERAWK